MGVVAVFGVVDARANGTIDQRIRATKKDAGTESHHEHRTNGHLDARKCQTLPSTKHASAGPCHPRTWNLKHEHDVSVARGGFLRLF